LGLEEFCSEVVNLMGLGNKRPGVALCYRMIGYEAGPWILNPLDPKWDIIPTSSSPQPKFILALNSNFLISNGQNLKSGQD
jgi:hypothetical protein